MVPSRKQYESMVPQSPVSKGPEAAALWRFRFLHHPVGLPLHNFNWRWFLARFSKTVWGTMVVIRNTRPQAHLNILQYLRMCIYIYIHMYVCIYIYIHVVFKTVQRYREVVLLYGSGWCSTPPWLPSPLAWRPLHFDPGFLFRNWEFPKIRRTLIWGPYNKDPTI